VKAYTSYYKSINLSIIIVCLVLAIILGIWLTGNSIKQIIFVILAVVGIGASIYRPKIPMFLFFLFIPLELFTLLPSQTLTKFIGLYLSFLLFLELSITKRIWLPRGGKSIWILIYGLAAILSLLASRDLSRSLTYLITLWLLIGMFFILSITIRDIKTLHTGILFLLIGGFLSIVISSITGQGWQAQALIVKGVRSVQTFTRQGGLWGDPNEFASILLVLMPLSLLQFFRSKSFFMKVFTFGLFACLLFGFFRTYSRGGFLGFAVLLVLSIFKFDLLKRGTNKTKIVIYVVLVAIVAIVIFSTISQTFIARIETLKSLDSSVHSQRGEAIYARYQAYKSALVLFSEHPILGVGIRNFYLYNPVGVVHNTYLEVLTCTGLIGFIPFVTILYLTWKELRGVQNSWRLRDRENSLNYQYAVALELGFIAYLVTIVFLTLDLAKMTWLLITLSSILRSTSANPGLVQIKT